MSYRIPDEVVTNHILVRLPVRSLLRYRSVCKLWRLVIDGPEFIQRIIHKYNPAATTTRNADDIFILALHPDSYIYYSIPYSSGRQPSSPAEILPQCHSRIPFKDSIVEICGSCHGLACLSHSVLAAPINTAPIYILNPATGKHHSTMASAVPDWLMSRYRVSYMGFGYGFGYDAGSKDYKFVRVWGMENLSDASRKVGLVSLGIRSNTLEAAETPWSGWIGQKVGVFLGGALHWSLRKHREDSTIAAYDLGTNQCREIPLPPDVQCRCELTSRLVELRNCLCLCTAQIQETISHVWMMKEYGVRASWSKLFSVPASGCFTYHSMMPLGLSVNGDEVVLHFNGARLAWYDTNKERPIRVMCLQDDRRLVSGDGRSGRMFEAIAFVASLARPDGN